jgi:uncharacterized damage-inducible protein DinB
MTIAESVLPEFDQEMASTRKVLERVPPAHADWKPHPKSFSMGDLAAHLANLPTWGVMTMDRTALDLNPPGGEGFKPSQYQGQAANLKTFDDNVTALRAALANASDADYMVGWSLLNGGKTVMTLPRVVCIRGFVLNHVIHHRGQMTVYLRMKDIPLPSIYGPSADEGQM